MQKHWDPENQYSHGDLKFYSHWFLGVNYCQPTIGTLVIVTLRPGLENFSGLQEEEFRELLQVMKEAECMLGSHSALRPNRYNYLQMGNVLHTLHFHLIPRYDKPRKFLEKTWKDPTYGHAPRKLSECKVGSELVRAIRDELKQYLRE
ncbi:HIT domain-containing protein [Candidatus Woesearchaeota archaeon]|nr:HIT domain-containing protein [Candidatus Woesearchaeota archaeon]